MKREAAVHGHVRSCGTNADRRLRRTAGLAIAAVGFAGAPLQPTGAAEFFAGKTIMLSTYAAPGDSYDLYLRLLSRHYGNHIPGSPRFVVINQPGGGGVLAGVL